MLDILAEHRTVSWATRNLLERMRNLGLIEVIPDGYKLTVLGIHVRAVGSEHRLETWRKELGRGALAGSGMHYGINARCSCREWTNSINESGPAAQRRIAKSHATHIGAHLITRVGVSLR